MKRRLVALVVVLPLFAACASIPERSDPKAVRPVIEGDASIPVIPPPRTLDSFGLVRNFVDTAAAPQNNHETARLHLTPAQQARWRTPSELLIVDSVDTIPTPRRPELPENVQIVRLKADKVGRLKADQSFVPEAGEYSVDLEVHRQPDGQWRVATPPPELVASRASFEEHFMPVTLYFLDHDWSGVVPDRRYVVSRPTPNLPRRVIDLLLTGPSERFRSAMDTALPEDVAPKTNPSEAADAALQVNLSDLRQSSPQVRKLIAAQVVLSLQSVSSSRVRLLEEGAPLLPEMSDLRPGDFESYEADNAVNPQLPGLAIVNERVHVLDADADPIPGPAGSGELDVVRAAQSADGTKLAAVVRTPVGVVLRIGRYGEAMAEVPLHGIDMTTPTWRTNSELWTVVDGNRLVQVVDNGDGSWVPRTIDTAAISQGNPIASLRLSHDGTRAAALVNGRVVIAGVRDHNGDISLDAPVVLTGNPRDSDLSNVEWLGNDAVVATTTSKTAPVTEISVDGYDWKWYESSNLVQPLGALTVSPTKQVVVVDGSGLWQASNENELWSYLNVPIREGSIPFYPG